MITGMTDENGLSLLVSVYRVRMDEVLVLVLDTFVWMGAGRFGGFRTECLRCRTFAAGPLELTRNGDKQWVKGGGGSMIFGGSRCR